MFLIYKTDAHHSYASRDLIGVTEDETIAIDIIGQQAKKEGSKINSTDLFHLHSMRQTQSYKGDGEFVIESVEVDELL